MLAKYCDAKYDRRKFEVVIIFDSCTDHSRSISCEFLRKNHIKYKFFEISAGSAGIARNTGLEAAESKYIWFVDGDDYLVKRDALKKLTAYISESDANAVYMKNVSTDSYIHDDYAVWRYFYKREIIKDIRFGNEKINEDWLFTQKIAKMPGYKEITITEPMYHYTFPRKGSIMANYFNNIKLQKFFRENINLTAKE